jgi:hypothetical protein
MTAVGGLWLLPPNSWAIGYWGGNGAAIGAALVLVALGRSLTGGVAVSAGLLMGLGIVELFFTRPYEGAVFVLTSVLATAWLAYRSAFTGSVRTLLRIVICAVPVILAGLAWDGYYNKAVTGNTLQIPYLLYDREYNVTPPFWILPLRPEPSYESPRLAEQHGMNGWEVSSYRQTRNSRFPPLSAAVRLANGLMPAFYFALPSLALSVFAWRDRRTVALLAVCLVCGLSLLIETWYFDHYAAAFITVMYLYCACALEAGIVRFRRVSNTLLAVTLAWAVCAQAVRLYRFDASLQPGLARERFIQYLAATPGDHLVVMRYLERGCPGDEWVYNGADIDSQRIVFAHDRGPENAALFDYYKARTIWLVTRTCNLMAAPSVQRLR